MYYEYPPPASITAVFCSIKKIVDSQQMTSGMMPTYPALMELFSNFPRTAQASAPGINPFPEETRPPSLWRLFHSQEC
ncbi:hypothetical protein DYD89_20480 [Salmonella enterica]|nr:hypothetical protein [Salmonella enterica]